MAKPEPTIETRPNHKNGHKPEPAVLPEQASEFAGIAEFSGGLIGVTENNSMQNQIVGLGDTRLRTVQRQALAAGIGQVQGNHHLQQVVSQLSKVDSATILRQGIGNLPSSPSTSSGSQSIPSGNPPTGSTNDSEQRYNLTIGSDQFNNVTREEALQALRRHYRSIEARLSGEKAGFDYQQEVRQDQPIVSFFSELLGGATMPDPAMFEHAQISLLIARLTLEKGDVNESVEKLAEAEGQYIECHNAFQEYIGATIGGAERSVTVLKVTAAAGAVAATVATGGIAAEAGAGLLATSTAVGGVAGGYGLTQEFAGQASERALGMRQAFDWAPILRRGAKDAILGFVGSLAGGALTGLAKRAFGSYLANLGEAELVELGKQMGLPGALPRDFLLTGGQKFFAEFVGGVGSVPLTTAVGAIVDRITGGAPPPKTVQEFVDLVIHDMVQAGAIQLFLGALMHTYGSTPSEGGTGELSMVEPTTPAEPVAPEPAGGSAASPPESIEIGGSGAQPGQSTVYEPHPFEFSETSPSGLELVTPAPAEFPIPEAPRPSSGLELGSQSGSSTVYEPHPFEFSETTPSGLEPMGSEPAEFPILETTIGQRRPVLDWSQGQPAGNLINNGRQVSGNFPEAAGSNEVLYRRNPATQQITSYQVYDSAGLPIKRVDVTGAAHGGVPTPHVVEFVDNVTPSGRSFRQPLRGLPRPAHSTEIP